jgi:hypothetical protein
VNRLSLVIVAATAFLGPAPRLAAQAPPGAEAPRSSADPHVQLRQILKQPLYQRWKLRQLRAESQDGESTVAARVRELMDGIGASLRGLLKKLFGGWWAPSWNPGTADTSTLLAAIKGGAWVALVAALVFMATILYRYFRDSRRTLGQARVLSRQQVRRALEDGQALAMAGPQWLQEAGRLAGEGDLRAVYRAMYLALLSGLHSGGRIEFRKSRTNWSYVSRFNGPEEHRRTFRELTTLFDDVWYGFKPTTGVDLDSIRAKVTHLVGAPAHDA